MGEAAGLVDVDLCSFFNESVNWLRKSFFCVAAAGIYLLQSKSPSLKLSIVLVQAGHVVMHSSQSQLHQLTAADLKAGPHQLTAQLILLYASNWQTSNGVPYLSHSSLPTFAASSASHFATQLLLSILCLKMK